MKSVYIKTLSVALLASLFTLIAVPQAFAGLLIPEKEKKSEIRKKTNRTEPDMWLLTYYVGYQNGYLKPRDIDYSMMTHIVVGGVGVTPNGVLNEHWHLQNGDGRAMALDVGTRAKREGVKTLIWLGGPNEEDAFYSATEDGTRATFVKNIVDLVHELGYDGVDIDWEPVRKQDEPHLLALVRDLRSADPDLIITVPVNWVPSSILFSKDLSVYKTIAQYVDKLFIMSYSMAGPWPGWESWHGGALGGDGVTTPGSLRSSVYAYTRAGVPEAKLGIGIGTYATCWEYPVTKPEKTIPATFYPKHMHTMSMRTLMEEYYKKKYAKWDSTANVPYLSYKKKEGDMSCGFISYEDERSVTEKVSYAKRFNLGGVMVWNIGTGYYPDERSREEKHHLLGVIAEEVGL